MSRSRRSREEERNLFAAGNHTVVVTNPGSRIPFTLYSPSVDSLIHKLRTMKILADSKVKLHVTLDLVQQFRDDPASLSRIIMSAQSYWLHAYEKTWSEPVTPVEELNPKTEIPSKEILGEDAVRKVEALASPKLRRAVRLAVTEHAHIPSAQLGISTNCMCGRGFRKPEEWANHVRSVIWKVLNESLDIEGDHSDPQENPD